ncbi:MAG: nuclear transport factor 2 family protein [Pseudomonadota bacterium]
MISQQEMSDRFEIQDLLYRYAELLDAKAIAQLRGVFTADAYIDYTAMGGTAGDLEETLAFLESAMTDSLFPNTQHLNANIQIQLSGDTASGRVMCFNPMEMVTGEGETQVFFLGLWYRDEYRRTEDGWRISRREEEKSWVFNTPPGMGF